MSTSDIINDTITPFVQRILSDPLQFKPAKHSEMVTHSPVTYIKIGTSQSKKQSSKQSTETESSSSSSPNKESQRSLLPRITSLAQAIAGYTNKRKIDDGPVGKKSRKARKIEAELNEEDDIGESLDQETENQEKDLETASSSEDEDYSNYEDAKTLPLESPLNLVSKKVYDQFDSKLSTSDSNNDDNNEEQDDDDDDEYTGESSDDDEVSEQEDDDDDEDTTAKRDDKSIDSSNSPSADKESRNENSSETESKSDEDEISQLKKDLLDDQRDPLSTNATPPTSPDSEEEPPQPQISTKLDNFYLLNENEHDRGSNNSKRILKNWGAELSALKPCGLLNHGVTCYTNAAVQAMIHIPAVQHYLLDILKNKYKGVISPRSVSHVLAETSARMWNLDNNKTKKSKIVNPSKLIGRLDDINCMMSEWQQEDSHEYFMSLLSRLQEDSTPKGHKLNESIIYDIFGGLLNQSVTCKNCGHVSKTNQEFYDLSLHLGNSRKNSQTTDGNSLPQEEETTKHRYSIQKSIKDFFSPELIKTDTSDKSGYVCENCKQRTNAIKISSIDRAPETLAVHLKRFRFNGSSSSKVKQGVSYPAMLDLSQYTTNGENVLYQLISVIVHEGRSVSSGHYIAHCRQPDGTWATYDDEYINAISESDSLRDPSAYYLIYTRLTSKEHDLPADVSTKNSIKLEQSTKQKETPVKSKSKQQQTSSVPQSPVSPARKILKPMPMGKKNKRLAILGHQPTNNLGNIGMKKIQKKYTKKPKNAVSSRFRKY